MTRSFKQWMVDSAIIARNFVDVTWPLRRLRRRRVLKRAPTDAKRFLILPSDPHQPSVSMGEMAMLTGLMQSISLQYPSATFTLVGSRAHRIVVPALGHVEVIPAWRGREGSIAFDRLLRRQHALFGIGADVLDGQYGAALVSRFAAYCNHAVEMGIPATIVGFSFNRTPRRPAVHALSRLHPGVRVNVRDQPSMDRFTTIVGIPAALCADVAFLMAPASEPEPDIENWIGQVRTAGRIPVGININAHAFSLQIQRTGAGTLTTNVARQLAAAGDRNKLAYLLIPHDFKGSVKNRGVFATTLLGFRQ
jgi:polysaccharide pyruvyl transferase WcaK-like protein